MEQIEQLVNAVTFDKNVPNFTKEIETAKGISIDTFRVESMFGRDRDHVYVRAKMPAMDFSVVMTKQEAMALACALLAQCHKLHELDAPNAEPTPVHFISVALAAIAKATNQ